MENKPARSMKEIRIKSPINNSERVKLLESITTSRIIDRYYNEFSFDVSDYFSDLSTVDIYRCEDTSYTFYYPFTIQGREDLYEHLEKYNFYYLKDRWEFKIPLKFAKEGDRLLEIGCGNGDALNLFKERKINCEGLELNKHAITIATENQLTIHNKTIQEFAIDNSHKYDLVCAFQLLEHLSEVKEFIDSSLMVLKSSGHLIVSVPNNDSFGHKYNTLNLPPHHMGLWNERSLKALEKFFPMKVEKIFFTPLEENQKKDFFHHYKQRFGRLPFGLRSVSRFNKLINLLVSKRKKGYTIVAVFKKI